MKKAILLVCALSLICYGGVSAGTCKIGHLFEGKCPVKAYVNTVKHESGQEQISVDMFKRILEDSLNNRKALDFDTINTPDESDIQIDAVIKKYQYLHRGPFNPSPGIATTLADAAATATLNYVDMEVLYTVTDTKSGKVIWTDDVAEYIKKTMTAEESIPLIFDKVTRTFITQCFGGAHKKQAVAGPM